MLTSQERVNHKRVWRVYRDLGLCVKRTRRKRLERALRPRPVLSAPNQEWAVDFVSDVSAGGRRLRIFTVVDSYTRECLALEVDTSLPSRRVTRAGRDHGSAWRAGGDSKRQRAGGHFATLPDLVHRGAH
jgi:putative transposase